MDLLNLIIVFLAMIFPIAVAIFVNIFCLRVAKEVSPRGDQYGSVITSPLLYAYFICSFPITLIVMWFPLGLSLLMLYGEDATKNLFLPSNMDEQMLMFIIYLILMTLIVAGFSIRAGELHRAQRGPGHQNNAGNPPSFHMNNGMVA